MFSLYCRNTSRRVRVQLSAHHTIYIVRHNAFRGTVYKVRQRDYPLNSYSFNVCQGCLRLFSAVWRLLILRLIQYAIELICVVYEQVSISNRLG